MKVPSLPYRESNDQWSLQMTRWHDASPKWLIEAYHKDALVYHLVREAIQRRFSVEDTFLKIIEALLARDQQRVSEINRLLETSPTVVFPREQRCQFWDTK